MGRLPRYSQLAAGMGLITALVMSGATAASAQTAAPSVASPPTITTFAGTGGNGYGGDGGPATSAKVQAPTGEAEDAAGNVYIADTLNNRIRRVDTNGVITTVAGSDRGGFSGDGGPATK